jgi:hypothetical protein
MIPYQHTDSRLALPVPDVVLLVLVATAACVPLFYDDRCGPEFREERVDSPLRDAAGTDLGRALFTLIEFREGEHPRSIHLSLIGPGYGSHGGPLKGHVTAVLLADAAGAVQLDVPVVPPPLNGDEIIATAVIPIDDITFSAARRAVLNGQLRLHLETSSAVPAVSDAWFPAASAGQWDRAHCS